MNILNKILISLLAIAAMACNTQQEQHSADAAPDETVEQAPTPVKETVKLPAIEIEAQSAVERQGLPKMTEGEKQEVAEMQEKDREYTAEMEQIKNKYPKMKTTLMPDPQGNVKTMAGTYKPLVEGIDNSVDLDRYIILMEYRFDNRQKKREKFTKNQEKPAQPVDGYEALYSHLKDELEYPEIAWERRIEGTVLVQFDIDEQGTVDNAMVTDGIEYEGDLDIAKAFNAAAIKAVRTTSGMWEPAKQGDQPLQTTLEIPVAFEWTP